MAESKIPPGARPPAGRDPKLCWPPVWGIYSNGGVLWCGNMFASKEEAEVAIRERCRGMCSVAEMTWREREAGREALTGNKQPPVWENQSWWTESDLSREHSVAVSEKDPVLIAYFQSPEKASMGIRTPIKPGRYLTKYFPELGENKIRFLAQWQATGKYPDDFSRYQLKFAKTQAEILYAYIGSTVTHGDQTRPVSCMSYRARDYESPIHPVAVYAAGDLAVAYLEDDNGPFARALCWPEKKVFGRVYPTPDNWEVDGFESGEHSGAAQAALFSRLKDMGWESLKERPRGFDGARLRLVWDEDRKTVTVPYLDNGYRFNLAGGYLRLSRDGDYDAGGTEGVAEVEGGYHYTCDHCGDGCGETYEIRVSGATQDWCNLCIENDTFYCHGYEGRVSRAHFEPEHRSGIGVVSDAWARANPEEEEVVEAPYIMGEIR